MKQTITQWNIVVLNQKLQKDLHYCQTELERILCQTICEKEMLTLASSKPKLTPGEVSVLKSRFSDSTLLRYNIHV